MVHVTGLPPRLRNKHSLTKKATVAQRKAEVERLQYMQKRLKETNNE